MTGTGTPSTDGLRALVGRGVAWAATGQGVTVALHSVVLLLLAWRLAPEEFGLVGLGTIYAFTLNSVAEVGLGAAIVQRERLGAPHLAAAFWLSLAAGTALGGGLWLAAGPIATLMREPALAPVLRPLALMVPIHALFVVPRALLQRSLSFRRLAATEIGAEVALAAVALTLAYGGHGLGSLVAGLLARHLVRAVLLWWARPWWPFVRPRLAECREVLGFGGLVMGSMLATQVVSNVDYFIVGRYLGAAALAYYTLAFQLTIIPVQRLCEVLSRVAFPSFARVRTDPPRLRRGLAQMLEGPTALVALSAMLLAVVGPTLVRAVYGEPWAPAAAPLRLLALAAPFYVLDSAHAVLRATGRPDLDLALDALRVGTFVVLAAAGGLAFGTAGVAGCLLLAAALGGAGKVLAARRLTGERAWGGTVGLACAPLVVVGTVVGLGVPGPVGVLIAVGAASWLAVRASSAVRVQLGVRLARADADALPKLAG